MYRISRNEQDPIVDVNTPKEIEPAIRRLAPGFYHVHQIGADASRSGHTSRSWGVAIRYADGSVVVKRDPREA
jgi:hypothetical protein